MATKTEIERFIRKEIRDLGLEGFLAKYEIALDEAKQELHEVEAFIRKHPLLTVGGAIVIGFYLRKLFE